MEVIGLDIGGANLKLADGRGLAVSRYFPLWQRPNDLPLALEELIALGPEAEHIAVTMTGELADCYRTKAEGVRAIASAVCKSAPNKQVLFYLTTGRFADYTETCEKPLLAAASNWHALARFASRYLPRVTGVLIDIGSTTTDIIPLVDGEVVNAGRTDPERLAEGTLIYSGVKRTPLCALAAELSWRGKSVPVAAELFASTHDVYLLSGDLSEEPDSTNTCDGRPATRAEAHVRMARVICADADMFNAQDALLAARQIKSAQINRLRAAAMKCLKTAKSNNVILAGEGEFLSQQALSGADCQIVRLSEQLDPQTSQAACAHAVAVLCAEDCTKS